MQALSSCYVPLFCQFRVLIHDLGNSTGTACFTDNDCIPAAGGVCVAPNTDAQCLLDEECTFKGFCNNSLYNLSLTPPPIPPPMQISFEDLSNAGTMVGGEGKFLTVKNFSFGFATFQIDEAGKGVLCYTIRNPEEDKQFVTEEGYVTDLKLINSMPGYVEARELHILDPTVTTTTPAPFCDGETSPFFLAGDTLCVPNNLYPAANVSHCEFAHTWDDVAENKHLYRTGGLGKKMSGAWQVWVCQGAHPCSDNKKDTVCFTYSEVHRVFVPWGYNSDLRILKQ